jgi:hypothetical protein
MGVDIMKKIIFVLLLISSMLLSGCSSGTTDTQTTTSNTGQEKTVASAPSVYDMNVDIKVDYLTYKITKAETFTEMGSSYVDKKTNGKFVKVYLDITNNAKETKQIFTPRFTIVDSQDRTFERLSDDIMYISDYLNLGEQLQPGLTDSGAVVFELPKDTQDLKLVIKGDWLSMAEVTVRLSNIQDIGKDTTLQKEQDATVNEAMNKCSAPMKCNSACPEYMGVGQKDCPAGQICCLQ